MKIYSSVLLALTFLGCGDGGSITETLPPVVGQVEVPENATALPLVVIQVEFNDYAFRSKTLTWQQKIFGALNGQLNHYFKEVSNNSFVFTQAKENDYSIDDGMIKVHLDMNHPDSGISSFENIAIPALSLADEFIDFKKYDTNANAQIDKDELQVMFLVAGGEEATGVHPSIWAHQFCIDGVVLDDTSVMQCSNGSYSAFGERHFDINGPDASIGIIAHELGHAALSLPDLYDIDYSSEGIGAFGLMGSGSWGYQAGQEFGETPVHLSAWSKIQVNFVTATTISSDVNNLSIDATDLVTYHPVRINTQDPNEYFLIENRSSTGYDRGMYVLDETPFEGGLAVWHIDETQVSNSNELNKWVDLEEADAKILDSSTTPPNWGDQSNLFKNANNSFTKDSTVSNSDLYDGSDTNVSITNISSPGSTMYVDIAL